MGGVGAFSRVDVEVKSTRERQTYYGALDYLTKQFVVQEYSAGNEDNTVAFLKYLQSLSKQSTCLLIIWDGASYHRSVVVQEFLAQVNGSLPAPEWKITCIRLAPNAPKQNPVEDVWLLALPIRSQVRSIVQKIQVCQAII